MLYHVTLLAGQISKVLVGPKRAEYNKDLTLPEKLRSRKAHNSISIALGCENFLLP